ncbi:hypothetical protein J4G08_20375 [Candidatus Poribacteria bacterium]|nr:hypothetical protein [Candidatus Poribacteria bacterium]
MNSLNRKLNELRQRHPELGKLLDELLNYKDGKGDYTVDRYNFPDPDIDTIVQEIEKEREVEKEKSNAAD